MNMKAQMHALTLERRQAATRLVNRHAQPEADPVESEDISTAPAPKPVAKRYRRQGKRLVPVTA